ncbi:NAD-dependent succinate-semialdehyde dehydrogenase [Novosphingobium terrae]|uniref:NAD-dependent succinate-semialdehyde dehydrogenase n=1 Tax=Novosphingobium terrae TaxID=2726189 RepID=UPI00197D0A7A|nr:NAD-dependent succinate-semialdehyde dehydrogenase [Novosphingobium terrae]
MNTAFQSPQDSQLDADVPAFPVFDPANGEVIGYAPDQDASDALAALDRAEIAYALWRSVTPTERARRLRLWAHKLREREDELAALISQEQGKPIAESRAEVAQGIGHAEWFAEEARRTYGEIIPEQVEGRRMMVVREPVGIVAAVTPWNFPMAMPMRKVAPALAAGCAIVLKPAAETPLTALALARMAVESGLPEGLFTVVTAPKERAAEVVGTWLDDSRVRKLTFTGSTQVGRLLAAQAAPDLKRLSMELGGNAAFIVFADADIDRAVACLIAAKFRNAGQTCISPNRVLVDELIHDRFAAALCRAVEALKVGPASDPASTVGPLISEAAVEKVARHIADAQAHGAKVMLGGRADGLFYQPTVLTGATPAMALAQEETFGPVAALFRFSGEADGIAQANATPFGLAAYFFTTDIERIWRVSAALEAGMIGINEAVISTEVAPFGGIKQSGYGREGSRHGLDDYQHLKYLCQGQSLSEIPA